MGCEQESLHPSNPETESVREAAGRAGGWEGSCLLEEVYRWESLRDWALRAMWQREGPVSNIRVGVFLPAGKPWRSALRTQ